MYYEDHVQQIAVDEHAGKTIEVGSSGVTVELVHYLPDARLDRSGRFQSQSGEPRNPLVELLVRVPNEDKPFRQVAFAKSPLLNLDGVYDRICPVKFVYQHPKIEPTTAIEFLQNSDGKLYSRTIDGRQNNANGEVATGSRLNLPGGFTLIVAEYLPHAQRQISFAPALESRDDSETLEPAAQVEIHVAGTREKLWLQRGHLEFQRRTIATPNGKLHVHFGSAQFPLEFALRLIDCYGTLGHNRDAGGASVVQLVDEDLKVDVQKQITATQPLNYRGFRLYQSATHHAGHAKLASVFRVVYSPGRQLKTVGIWTMVLGVVTMFVIRAYWSIGLARQWQAVAA
jgi:hypothetical protein